MSYPDEPANHSCSIYWLLDHRLPPGLPEGPGAVHHHLCGSLLSGLRSAKEASGVQVEEVCEVSGPFLPEPLAEKVSTLSPSEKVSAPSACPWSPGHRCWVASKALASPVSPVFVVVVVSFFVLIVVPGN